MKAHVCIATVTVKAPDGYRPRTLTYKLACYVKERGFRARDVEHLALQCVKERLMSGNPGLDLRFSVSSKTETVFGICDYDGLKKEVLTQSLKEETEQQQQQQGIKQ